MDSSPTSGNADVEQASTPPAAAPESSAAPNGAAPSSAAPSSAAPSSAAPSSAAPNGAVVSSAGGKVVLNRSDHTVKVDGTPVALSPREFELLAVLMESTGRVVPSQYLLQLLWGPTFDGDPSVLAVYMYRLRAKLGHGEAAAHLRTVRSIGYAFDLEPVRY